MAIGHNALFSQNFTTATSNYNIAIGYNTGEAVTTGTRNTFVGGQAGDALTKLHYGAYKDAQDRARLLQQDRLGAAGRFGQTALTNLGIGREKFGSQVGAFRDDRAYQDRDLDF